MIYSIRSAFSIFLLGSLVIFSTAFAPAAAAQEGASAVILIYHRFGEDGIPSTNIRLDQFEGQIAELTNGPYHTVALPDIARAIQSGEPLPERSVAITVDDAYESAYTDAWPRLRAAGIPMALFVSTDPVDQGLPGYLSWEQIRALAADGVVIGHHGAGHIHMIDEGVEASRADIERASRRFQTELGFIPELFAYPYGEYSREIADLVKEMGFTSAFAQYSGAVRTGEGAYSIPRFPINEQYGDLNRFQLITNARALPASNIIPADTLIDSGNNPPAYGFSVTGVRGLSAMNCFPSHMSEAARLEIIDNTRIEVRFSDPFPKGRNRINCTMPGPDRRWYWLGKFFYAQ